MMSEVKTILWTEAGMHHKQALALLLGQDNALRDSLGAYRQITLASLEKEQTDWLKGHCQTLVVLVEDSAVGMISMGGLNCRYVSIGYWIGSAWWGQGMMTQAFTQLVAYAKDESIFGLRARIAHDNAPSIALWKRKGARIIGMKIMWKHLSFCQRRKHYEKELDCIFMYYIFFGRMSKYDASANDTSHASRAA